MHQAAALTTWQTGIRSSLDGSSYTTRYTIPRPTVKDTWQSWSQNVTGLPSGTRYVALWHEGNATVNRIRRIECADVTVTLDSSKTPTSSIGAEGNAYQLRARLANLTTGESLVINFDMALGSSLEIDTDTLRVTYLADGSRQFQAVTPDGQAKWLAGPMDQTIEMAPRLSPDGTAVYLSNGIFATADGQPVPGLAMRGGRAAASRSTACRLRSRSGETRSPSTPKAAPVLRCRR